MKKPLTVNVYLTFDGSCRDAFEFYSSVFQKEIEYIGTFGEMPPQPDMPPVSEELKDKVMHVSLPISDETRLMGSDAGGDWGKKVEFGNNFSISVNTGDSEEATKIFNRLAEGGTITMPMEETFWQSYFGMLIDKFGINWMVNCELETHKDFEQSAGK